MQEESSVSFAVVVDDFHPPPKIFKEYTGRARLLQYLALVHPIGVCIGLVFTMLDGQELARMRTVCEHWLHVTTQPRVLKRLYLGSARDRVYDPIATRLIKGGTGFLTHISITHCGWLTNRTVELALNACTLLVHLDCSHCLRLTDRAFLRPGPDLFNFISLNISGCRLTDQAIVGLIQRGVALEQLTARGCRNLRGQAIARLQHLGFLDVSNCIAMDKGVLLDIVANCSSICSLEMAESTHVDDEFAEALAVGLLDLQQLNISGSIALTNSGLYSLLNTCTNLRNLNLSQAAPLNIRIAGTYVQDLEELRLNDMKKQLTDENVAVVLESCPKLQVLEIAGSKQLSKQVFDQILLSACAESLRDLNLSCSSVTENTISAFLYELPVLRSLKLLDCPALRDSNTQDRVIYNTAVRRASVGTRLLGWNPLDFREHGKAYERVNFCVKTICTTYVSKT